MGCGCRHDSSFVFDHPQGYDGYLVLFIKTPIAVPYCWLVCIVGMISSLEELIIHLTSDEYDPNRKMLVKRMSSKSVKR